MELGCCILPNGFFVIGVWWVYGGDRDVGKIKIVIERWCGLWRWLC